METKISRTYENALRILETRRRRARPKDIPNIDRPLAGLGQSNGYSSPTFRGKPSLTGMKRWLEIIGHSESDLNTLNVVHVAGTKGKGSTCAFVRSLLRAHGQRTGFPKKIGLYTSPHLRCIRERIQINDQPILEDLFAKYFFEVWDRLQLQQPVVEEKLPRYLQLLALVAFHSFLREKTDATIFETHHGGEYDATNVVQKPAVTGITSIGMDHVAQLGPTLENIAWHKAGIFKPGTPAFSSPQPSNITTVFQARAAEKKVELKFVQPSPLLPSEASALQAPVQQQNCSLAIAISNAFVLHAGLPKQYNGLISSDISQGVAGFSWPGRFEVITEGKIEWFLDGAHNELSITQAAEWFAKNVSKKDGDNTLRILIFSHFSDERDGRSLLKCLAKSLAEFGTMPDYVLFTTFQERDDSTTRIDKSLETLDITFPELLEEYSDIWRTFDPQAVIGTEQTIEAALSFTRNLGGGYKSVQTLVTGSLYLVGGALNLLQPR